MPDIAFLGTTPFYKREKLINELVILKQTLKPNEQSAYTLLPGEGVIKFEMLEHHEIL